MHHSNLGREKEATIRRESGISRMTQLLKMQETKIQSEGNVAIIRMRLPFPRPFVERPFAREA